MADTTLTPSELIAHSRDQARRLARGETTVTRLVVRGVWRSPKAAAAWLLGLGAIGIVAGNMLTQPEKHAYPMFAGNPVIHADPVPAQVPVPLARPGSPERNPEAVRQADLLRDIQFELGRRGFFAGQPDANAAARTQTAIRDFQAAAGIPVTGQPTEALLAAILTSNARPRDTAVGSIRPSIDRLERAETVTAVQRALNRLNYGPLKEDGQLGPGTRAALDRFEKDRKLPARSENPNRVLRELARASGIAIE